MCAPRRFISCTCIKRFSKIVSVTRAIAASHAIDCHELRLHIGRKPGYSGGAEADRFWAATHLRAYPIWSARNDDACFTQFIECHIKNIATRFRDSDIATCRGDGAQEGGGFDAISDHCMRSTMQGIDTLNRKRSVPIPVIFAPIVTSKFARSVTSGSRAAFSKSFRHQPKSLPLTGSLYQ